MASLDRLVAFLSFPFCKDLYSETTSKTHSTYHKCSCLTHLEDLCTPISLWKLCKGVTYGRPKFNTRNGAVGAIFHFDISQIWGVLKFSVYHFRVSNRPEVATVQPLYSSEEEPGRKLFIKACDLWLDLFFNIWFALGIHYKVRWLYIIFAQMKSFNWPYCSAVFCVQKG